MHPRSIVLSPTTPEGVRVNGLGKASAPPDVARANIGVEVRGATPEAASDDAAKRIAAVLVALHQLGIADKDLRTHSYSVSFEPEPTPPVPPSPQPTAAVEPATPVRGSYRVTNMIAVTIRDLKSVGKVLKAATDNGANNVWGVSFDLEDDSALITLARQMAVVDAKHAAEELSKLTGVKLGEIVSISEGEQQPETPAPAYALQSAVANTEVPVEQGEITVSYPVQIVYATARD